MREIKFRSWYARDKEMYFPDSIANDIDGERHQIMQYTGLKDCKGKEIYEGDVIRFKNEEGGIEDFEVFWKDGAFRTLWIGHPSPTGQEDVLYWTDEADEVIGNIYENPELLKAK